MLEYSVTLINCSHLFYFILIIVALLKETTKLFLFLLYYIVIEYLTISNSFDLYAFLYLWIGYYQGSQGLRQCSII